MCINFYQKQVSNGWFFCSTCIQNRFKVGFMMKWLTICLCWIFLGPDGSSHWRFLCHTIFFFKVLTRWNCSLERERKLSVDYQWSILEEPGTLSFSFECLSHPPILISTKLGNTRDSTWQGEDRLSLMGKIKSM